MGSRLSRVRRLVLGSVAGAAGAQLLTVGALVAAAELRKRRKQPGDGFPWEVQRGVELESGRDTLTLHPNGARLYETMLAEIEAAEQEIFLETFIWKGDEVGRRFVESLAAKAREGVAVYVIFDGFANMVVPAEFKRFPKEIHTLHFRPIDTPRAFVDPRNLFRDHRKILVVDGRVGFVGGFNIGSLYGGESFRDTHLQLRGKEVRELENAFVDFWNNHRPPHLPEIDPVRERDWNPELILHRNDPYMRIFPIRGMYLEAIDRASKHIYLTHAYFIPDRAMRKGLIEAVHRGVDVQILLPRQSNHVTADWLGRQHFHELLAAGVRVFAYENIMIHSKTATIDGVWSTVGTANIDRFSLLGNYEVNLEIYGRNFAAQMERMFELDKANASEITLREWVNRPLPSKLAERIISSLSPLA